MPASEVFSNGVGLFVMLEWSRPGAEVASLTPFLRFRATTSGTFWGGAPTILGGIAVEDAAL